MDLVSRFSVFSLVRVGAKDEVSLARAVKPLAAGELILEPDGDPEEFESVALIAPVTAAHSL